MTNLELPFPKLTPHLARTFDPLCKALPPEQAIAQAEAVTTHLIRIQATLQTNEFLDVRLAEAIARALLALLADYATFLPKQQALIIGAARYFVKDDDVEPDSVSILGFDDDARVLNYVLDVIDRPELKVKA